MSARRLLQLLSERFWNLFKKTVAGAIDGSRLSDQRKANIAEAPVLAVRTFFIPEKRAAGALVVTAVATVDTGRTATYSIVSGNTRSAFAINSTSGKLIFNMPLLLDYEWTRTFFLRLRVTDSAGLMRDATWTINLIDFVGAWQSAELIVTRCVSEELSLKNRQH